MKTILNTKNLLKSFGGVNAVDNLSLNIPEGKITGLVGPNGSGKTTLINLLSGLMPISGGEILIFGARREKIIPWENPVYGVTRTFQQVRVFEQMSALDNILVLLTDRNPFASIFERHTEFHLRRVEEVLKKVGLWEKRNFLAENLS